MNNINQKYNNNEIMRLQLSTIFLFNLLCLISIVIIAITPRFINTEVMQVTKSNHTTMTSI
jgi:hypothetical protein